MKKVLFPVVLGLFVLALGATAQAARVWSGVGLTLSFGGHHTVTVEDLAAAALQPGDAARLPHPENWWPSLPEFYQPGGYTDVLPGEQGYVVRKLVNSEDKSKERLESAVTLYDTELNARRAYFHMLSTNDKHAELVRGGPTFLAREARYLRRNAKEGPTELTLRFQEGRCVARVSLFSAAQEPTVEAVARYAAPVAQRVRRLEQGRLRAARVPSQYAHLLPSERALASVATRQGTVVLPSESWALIEQTGTPNEIRDLLHRGGAKEIVFSSYQLRSHPGHVVELTLFVFSDASAAEAWVKRSMKENDPSDPPVSAGTPQPAWFHHDPASDSDTGGVYEYQFAHGRVVCDVSGYASFEKTANIAEEVRQVAEAWAGALGK